MDSSNPKYLEVTTPAQTDGFDNSQGDLIRSLKREIKLTKAKVTNQDIRIFEMQALLQSGKGLSNIPTLPTLLDTFMAVVRERYDLTNSCVLLKQEFEIGEKEHIQVKRYFGLEEQYEDSMGRKEPLELFRIEKNNGLLWQLIQQGNVFSVRDLQKEPRFTTAWEKMNLDVLRSDFWCPLIKSGEVIGVLTLGERRDGSQVAETEFSFVQELASLATTIIDSTLRYEQTETLLKNQKTLYEFSQQVSTINDSKILCVETIKNAVNAVKAQRGNIMLVNPETGKLEMKGFWSNIDENVIEDINSGRIETKSFNIGEGIVGQAALLRKAITKNNRDDIDQYGSYEAYCICSIPVENGDKLEGVMTFTNKVHVEEDGTAILDIRGRFTKDDLDLLKGLARQSAVSLHKSRLYLASITDRLTGLCNARHFDDIFYEQAASYVLKQKPLTLALLDIDHFKQFNDKYGHQAGDYILKEVATSFLSLIRPGSQDQAYRYGGEEFCLVMPETTVDVAFKRVDEFREQISKKEFSYEGKPLKVTVSIGVAQTGLHSNVGRILFSLADDALYECKRNGRNQVIIAKPEKDAEKKVG